mgnify:CR=1 FL=1
MENPYLVKYTSDLTKDLFTLRLAEINDAVEIGWMLERLKTPFLIIDLKINKNIVFMRKDKAEKMFKNQIISNAYETFYV